MYVRFPLFLLAVLMPGLMAGCGEPQHVSVQGTVMGSYYVFNARCADPETAFRNAATLLAELDADLTTYQEGSRLMRLNRAAVGEPVVASPAMWAVLSLSGSVRSRSGGAFDVASGALVNAWGFGPVKTESEPDEATIRSLLPPADGGFQLLPPDRVARTRQDVFIDLSAVAPGYGTDLVIDSLKASGCTDAMVDVGGEVRAYGLNGDGRVWRIGIETPAELQTGIQAVVELKDVAIATSGDYRKYREVNGRRISHTIDPRDGYPIRHGLASVSVVQATAAEADAWATAINVLGPDAGFAFAEQHAIPAYFLLRSASGFDSRYTEAMKAYLEQL